MLDEGQRIINILLDMKICYHDAGYNFEMLEKLRALIPFKQYREGKAVLEQYYRFDDTEWQYLNWREKMIRFHRYKVGRMEAN